MPASRVLGRRCCDCDSEAAAASRRSRSPAAGALLSAAAAGFAERPHCGRGTRHFRRRLHCCTPADSRQRLRRHSWRAGRVHARWDSSRHSGRDSSGRRRRAPPRRRWCGSWAARRCGSEPAPSRPAAACAAGAASLRAVLQSLGFGDERPGIIKGEGTTRHSCHASGAWQETVAGTARRW